MVRFELVIIGGGAAGVLLAAHLEAAGAGRARVALIDAGPGPAGTGVAYRTTDDAHHLNVRAGNLSARHDDPDHFTRWLGGTATALDYLPRSTYGRYLNGIAEALDVQRFRARAVSATRSGGEWLIHLADGSALRGTGVVLATGIEPPSASWAPRHVAGSPRFVADPWAPDALAGIGDTSPVLLIGTGLTAIDLALTLSRTSRPVTAVSRHGLLPAEHLAEPGAPMAIPAGDLPRSLAGLRQLVRRCTSASLAATGDWRPAIDGLRPHLQSIWAGLDDCDRTEFLRHDRRRWETARHRMAPAVAERIRSLRSAGQFTVRAAGAREAIAAARPGTWIVNATGPDGNPLRSADPLTRQLLSSGLARTGPLCMGLDTTTDGQVRGEHGVPAPGLWTLGCTRRGTLWESTAIPEIRAQAHALGALLAGRLTPAPAPDLLRV